MTLSGAPSWASSTACAWRSWCGADRRRTPALAATRRSCVRATSLAECRPGSNLDDAQQGADRHRHAEFEPRPEVFEAPRVHADLPAAAALAVAHEYRLETRVEVVL